MRDEETGVVTTTETPEQAAAYWDRCRALDLRERELEAERSSEPSEDDLTWWGYLGA